MNGRVSYGLVVTLNDTEASAIVATQPGAAPVADKLSIVAGGLLRDQAKGGVMIPPEWAGRIYQAIGGTAPEAIVEHVEKSVGRLGESPRVEWIPDPSQVQFYQMQADNAGITLAHQLKAHMDYGYMQGWLGMGAPDPFKILLTPEQYRWLQQLFSKDSVTGEDVVDKLQALVGSIVTEEEDDLVFDALREETK